jgi:uncharacterized Zn finger protein
MSRWWYDRPRYTTAKPREAAGGIAAKSRRGAIGQTWWSKRFIAVLESFQMGARLGRGKRYARSGQVMNLKVGAGRATASVQGTRKRPYSVELRLQPFSEAQWDDAVARMAGQAVYAARLLAGEMPEQIEEVFEEAGLSLFPARPAELVTSCSCPDWANPCKHLAATLFILAERFDQDPWQILAWRGREREPLLEQMRSLRAVGAGPDAQEEAAAALHFAPLPDARDPEAVAQWYGGEAGALETAQRAVAQALAAGEGSGPAGLLELLGPIGVEVDDRDLSVWLRPAWREPEQH